MKLKYMPNAFSIARILLCIPLAILTPLTLLYIILFAFTAITDTIDGQLARRIKDAKSELGATLDSIADICLVSIIIFAIMPSMQIWSWLWIVYSGVLLLKVFVSTSIGYIRFKEFISLHTISFKILVTFLFCYPILYFIIGAGLFINIFSIVVIACALLIVIEEILIISMLKQPERNIKSIFDVRAANEQYKAS